MVQCIDEGETQLWTRWTGSIQMKKNTSHLPTVGKYLIKMSVTQQTRSLCHAMLNAHPYLQLLQTK